MAYNGPCLFLNMEAFFAILSGRPPMLIDVFVKHECPRGNEVKNGYFIINVAVKVTMSLTLLSFEGVYL